MDSRQPSGLRGRALVAAALVAALASGCTTPEVGPADLPPPPATGYLVTLTGARLIGEAATGDARAVVAFTLTLDGAPVPEAELSRLRPSFTLAGLLTDPVSGLLGWQSLVLTGATLTQLPLGGPGTPPGQVLRNTRQPGAETTGTYDDLGGGAFEYTFATALPAGFDDTRTLRAGVWLAGVPGAAGTSATVDFVKGGGTPAQRETVLDARCDVCHGRLTAHGGFRAGVKLCLTCHTIQNADQDTTDPAALAQALTANPLARTVVAGTGATSIAAALRHSTAAVGWSLSAGAPGTLSATSGAAVTYTPPASVAGPTTLTVTAAAAGFSAPVTITVVPPEAPAPAVAVSPPAQTLVASPIAPAVRLTALLSGVAAPVAWSLSPPTGAGTLSTSTTAAVDWTPPGRVTATTTVTITATAGGQSGSATVTVEPTFAGHATPDTDPSPLDLGRMAHRIHRGKKLPTLFLASSRAPAPALPVPGGTSLPLPFFPGRNAAAPGAVFEYVGFRSTSLLVGKVVTRTDNGQPAARLAEGIGFPRDLRDCDACHAGAPQAAEVVTAISRRTCQGCHPDVWYGASPITDLVHMAHPGGPQPDDTRCAGCHVRTPSRPTVILPHDAVHLPPALSPYFNEPVVTIEQVTGLKAGERPTIVFTVRDRVGPILTLNAPSPATEAAGGALTTPSPVPRALQRLAFLLGGPASDVLTGNVPFQEQVPLTLAADAQGRFSHTLTGTMPAGASGTWALSVEARRALAVPLTGDGGATFNWPYTGESITEFTDNPVIHVDVTHGSWPGGAPVARRVVVERARCEKCHQELSLHGGLRHNPEYCVMCHTADGTDWNRRPKGPTGNVNLGTVYSDTKFGTYDGLEERSIHFEVMVHRLHTGEGQGTARLELGAPHVIYGFGGTPFFFDDIRFPNRLANCLLCHAEGSYLLEAIPAGTPDTVANETATIQHAATQPHGASEARVKPLTAACTGCHGTAYAAAHAARYTSAAGVEQCATCHSGRGALSVPAAHGLAVP